MLEREAGARPSPAAPRHEFTTYVEDRSEPGSDADTPDRFWLEVRDRNDDVILEFSVAPPGYVEAVDLMGGNLHVPQPQGGGERRR